MQSLLVNKQQSCVKFGLCW